MAKSFYKELADKLKALLKLEGTPLAISFLSAPPSNIKRVDQPEAACTMWKKATKGAIYATAEDHYPCAFGVEIMGFKLTSEGLKAREDFIKIFSELGIFTREGIRRSDERVPKIKPREGSVVVYMPLDEAETDPDVVLLACTPAQSMELAEACGREDGDAPDAFLNMAGCALLSGVYLSGRQGISLACHGSRNYAHIDPEKLLFAMPGKQLAILVGNLEKIVEGRKRYMETRKA